MSVTVCSHFFTTFYTQRQPSQEYLPIKLNKSLTGEESADDSKNLDKRVFLLGHITQTIPFS